MLVLHITLTPLAGAPIRIVNAINKYTEFDARLINFNPNSYQNRTFPEDLIWEKDKKECLFLISNADIIHLHHFIDIDSDRNPFCINFKKIAPKAKFIRHFHSDINHISPNNTNAINNDEYPKLVIPHYPERTFLNALIIPNIIPINDKILLPFESENTVPKVFFSVSSPYSMWHCRWNTKGLPEVKNKLIKLQKKCNFELEIIQNLPYTECQRIKQCCDIVIGDTTSGSYHLTDLEALSQGKPTFTYLDSRTQFVLQNLLQCDDLPFINTRIEELDLPFCEIVKDKKLQKDIGNFSRKWIEKYYDDKNLIQFYVNVYFKLLNNEPIKRENYTEFENVKTFLYNTLYDFQWQTRKSVYQSYNFFKIPKPLVKLISLFIFNKSVRRNFRAKYL